MQELGPYNYDAPAPRLWGEAPGVFNAIFLALDDYEQLKQEVYLLTFERITRGNSIRLLQLVNRVS